MLIYRPNVQGFTLKYQAGFPTLKQLTKQPVIQHWDITKFGTVASSVSPDYLGGKGTRRGIGCKNVLPFKPGGAFVGYSH